MSHTTTVDGIVFNDIDALRLAVRDLQKSGVKCDLVESQPARAYYTNQAGMEGNMDYVLKLHDSPYDVGFRQDAKAKGLTARTDLWGGHVQRILGAPAKEGENAAQAALGKLYQSYAINAATRQAVKQGYAVRRVVKPDGTVQLIMNVH